MPLSRCSSCGLPVSRGATSAEHIVCLPCRKARRIINCEECGRPFDPQDTTNMRSGNRKQRFCSRSCRMKWQRRRAS